ncbi:MAG: hypothetical protein QXM27_02835 [Candidatus Pacearchaeota archaeon]
MNEEEILRRIKKLEDDVEYLFKEIQEIKRTFEIEKLKKVWKVEK